MADDKGKKPSDEAEDEVEEAEASGDASIEEPQAGAKAASTPAPGSARGDEAGGDDTAAGFEPVVPPKAQSAKGQSPKGEGPKGEGKSKKKSGKKAGGDQALKSKVEAAAAAAPATPGRAKAGKQEMLRWPVDKDHRSSIKLLTGEDAAGDIDLSEDPALRGPGAVNLVLLLVIVAVAVVGTWQFMDLSSAETLAAKREAREEIEKKHLEEQQAKQKKYGVLRIETSPGQADVFRDGQKMVTTKPDTGEEIVVQTPTNMMNTEITPTYKFRVEKPGYEPFEFTVSEHLWTKDVGTNEYKFVKMIELIPNVCEYWFLYDAKMRREMKFEDGKKEGDLTGKDACQTYYEDAVGKGVSVTECTCKLPPEGVVPPVPGAAPQK